MLQDNIYLQLLYLATRVGLRANVINHRRTSFARLCSETVQENDRPRMFEILDS